MGRVEFIFTIGYEGASLVSLIEVLKRRKVTLVLDVRRDAWSRRTCFRKGELEKELSDEGIIYRHEPGLGVPKEVRERFRDGADPNGFAAWYSNGALLTHRDLLGELAELVGSRATALLCYEADPRRCHRSLLALELGRRARLPIRHLNCGALELDGGALRLDY